MRRLLIVLGVLYAAVLLYLVLGSLFSAPDPTREATPDPQIQPPSDVSQGGAVSRRPSTSSDPSSAQAGRTQVDVPMALPLADGLELQGRLTVIDADGGIHPSESGSFAMEWGSWPEVHSREVRVDNGAFRERVPTRVELSVSNFRLGGRTARAEVALVTPAADGRLELSVRWGRALELSVIDARDRAPLTGIEVAAGLRGQQAREPLQTDIDPALVILSGGVSPLSLPGDWGAGPATLWVRAPGYAWTRIDLDLFSGGRREMALERCGELELEIVGLEPGSSAVLRLYGGPAAGRAGAALTRDPRAANPCLLQGLPTGTYVASVELGSDLAQSEVLGELGVQIEAGVRVRERLVLEPRDPGDPAAPVSGTLWLPHAYLPAQPHLLLAPMEGGNPARATQKRVNLAEMNELDAQLFAWSAGELLPGRYLLEVAPLGVQQILEVRPGGERDVRVVVEAPGELVIVPYDAATGERIAGAIATWSGAPPEGLTNWTPTRVLADPQTRQVELRGPAGTLRIEIQAPGYAVAQAIARIEAGRHGLSVPMERSCELQVSIQAGDAAIPWSGEFQVDALELGGPGKAIGWRALDGNCRVALSGPGAYRVSLRVPASFEAPAAQEVLVLRGAPLPLRFSLQRRP